MPARQGLPRHHIISASRSLPSILRSALAFAPFVLCFLITITATTTWFTSQTTSIARSACVNAFPYSWNEHGLGNPHPPTVSQTVNSARALEAVSVLILRHISPLVHRSALASRASTSSDNQGPRISGQALTVIILCSTIASCVLVGCLLQLPTVLISLRNRYFRSGRTATPTPTPSSSNNMPGLFDVEMSDQDLAESLDCSPPPPYSRAPSYEGSGNNNISTGGRSGGEYTS